MLPATSSAFFAPVPTRSRKHSTRPTLQSSPSAFPPPAIGLEMSTQSSIPSYSFPRDAPPYLLSPVYIPERRMRPQCPASPTPQCASPRRRRTAYTTRSKGRTRHCRLVDCSVIRGGSPSAFDKIPWISMLDATPAADAAIPLDVSDLELAPAALSFNRDYEPPSPSTKGPGPIRSRKSSLRSAPFPLDLPEPPLPDLIASDDVFETPFTELPFSNDASLYYSSDDDVPKTPPMRASALPIDAGFHNLMPIAYADVHADEDGWPRKQSSP